MTAHSMMKDRKKEQNSASNAKTTNIVAGLMVVAMLASLY